MNETIYNSNAEEGLLRSVGPHTIYSSDKSISGVKILRQYIFGETNIYETSKVIETTPIDNNSITEKSE